MNLSALLAVYGDDKVQFQKLDDCVTAFQMTKHGTKATFGTPQGFNGNGFDKLGLIVWLDRKAVADILTKQKPAEGGKEKNDAR